MKSYRHILVLIHDERDGLPLLRQTVAMVRGLPIAITVGHLNADYAELEYGSDALVKDRQAQEVIAAKAMLSRLVSAVDAPVAVRKSSPSGALRTSTISFIRPASIWWWSGTKTACSASIPHILWNL